MISRVPFAPSSRSQAEGVVSVMEQAMGAVTPSGKRRSAQMEVSTPPRRSSSSKTPVALTISGSAPTRVRSACRG